MALSQNQVQDVCCYGGGHKQCRFLDGEYMEDASGDVNYIFICRKKSPPDKSAIDDEVDEFLDECKNNNQDPTKQYVALGDNCTGYHALKVKLQGYDV